MANNDLSSKEVNEVIYASTDVGVTNELYAFGVSLLSDLKQRSQNINTKATTVLGWATGILAFLFTQNEKLIGCASHMFALSSSLVALLASIAAFLALRTRDDWKSPSDRSWFQSEAVVSGDEMKRYHLRVMYDEKKVRQIVNQKKGYRLMYAELLLVLSGLLLFLGLAVHLSLS